MSAFAPIVPPQHLEELQKQNIFGNYHLLLAHEVIKYESFYAEAFEDFKGTVIMDNSTVELGEPVKLKDMKRACEIVPATYVVLPDVLNDPKKTLAMHKEHYKDYAKLTPREDLGLMCVPQGTDEESLYACIRTMLSSPFGLMGISRSMTRYGVRREDVAAFILSQKKLTYLHMLGCSDNLLDDIVAARMPNVMGIDSSLPYLQGVHRKEFTLDHPFMRMYRKEDTWGQQPWNQRVGTFITQMRKWLGAE